VTVGRGERTISGSCLLVGVGKGKLGGGGVS